MSKALHSRIQLRAYYLWLNDSEQRDAAYYWLYAERQELQLLKWKRSEAAKRGAATKRKIRNNTACIFGIVTMPINNSNVRMFVR